MSKEPTAAQTLQATLDRATRLDPPAIARAILADAVDDGMRASTLEARVSGSGDKTSIQERRVMDPTLSGPHLDHMIRLNKHGQRFLDAISELNAEVLDAGTADDWDEAISDAQMMLEVQHGPSERQAAVVVTALLYGQPTTAPCVSSCVHRFEMAQAIGRNVEGPVEAARLAVAEVASVADRYFAHAPRPSDSARSDLWCRAHLQIGAKRQRDTRLLCRWCWRQVQDLAVLGDPVELQMKPDLWPDDPMLRAHVDQRYRDVGAYRRDWLLRLGVDPARTRRAS